MTGPVTTFCLASTTIAFGRPTSRAWGWPSFIWTYISPAVATEPSAETTRTSSCAVIVSSSTWPASIPPGAAGRDVGRAHAGRVVATPGAVVGNVVGPAGKADLAGTRVNWM